MSCTAVIQHLDTLSRFFHVPVIRGENHSHTKLKQATNDISEITKILNRFAKAIQKGQDTSDLLTRHAWKMLDIHQWYCRDMAILLNTMYSRDSKQAALCILALKKGLQKRLPSIADRCDTYTLMLRWNDAVARFCEDNT